MKHTFKLRVYYHDTDQMGVVYYANYIKWFEMARTELLREAGMSYKDCEAQGILLPVAECAVKYLMPAKYDDEISVVTWLVGRVKAKMTFEHRLCNQDGMDIATGHVVLACLDPNRKIQMIPEHLRAMVMGYHEDNHGTT